MNLKLYKVSDKIIFTAILTIIVLWNLKYLSLIIQVPFTMFFVDFKGQNEFYTQVMDIREATETIPDFNSEKEIGFFSDTSTKSVFDMPESIKDFYIVQYALVPKVLKNDTDEKYTIAVYDRLKVKPQGLTLCKKVNGKTYIYKRIEE